MILQAPSLCPVNADPHNGEQKTASPTTTRLQMSRELTRGVHLSLHYLVSAALRCSNMDGCDLSQEMRCQMSQTSAQMLYQWMYKYGPVLCPIQAVSPVSTSPERAASPLFQSTGIEQGKSGETVCLLHNTEHPFCVTWQHFPLKTTGQ